MLHDPLRSPGQLFTQLLGEFGWIAEIRIVDVHILCDDRFYPAAHPVCGLALGNPDRCEQIEYVARPDLDNCQGADRRIGIALERGRPLAAVFLAPL